jgi:single-strand DNA-binding protein
MAKSVNKVILLGNVGQPPEVKSSGNGTLRASVSLATNERRKVGDNWEDFTEWHRVVFFGRLAEIVRDYVRKGSKLFIEGKLRTHKWDENGSTRYSTNVVADDISLLSGAADKPAQGAPAAAKTEAEKCYESVGENDIPF